MNQTLADMFGYHRDELIGHPVEILIPENMAQRHRHHVLTYSNQPQLRDMGAGRDLEAAAKDGRRFPVEIGLKPAQTDSGPMVVATIIDISQRKDIENRLHRHEEQLEQLVTERTGELMAAQQEKERVMDQLIQAEKMSALGTLVSGIGHEINNPLYVIYATAEALVDENDAGQCRLYGEEILKQARHIRETVKNLSLYVQPGSRHDLQSVDLAESINEAIHLAQRTLRGDDIEFQHEHRAAVTIAAKSEEIQQILFNILRNAIQAIEGKGRVRIEVLHDNNEAEIRIEDTGKGIPLDKLNRVFDPFFTTKGPDEGEGLGLYIVHQIVSRYQGSIRAEQVANGGTRFVLRFPAIEQTTTEEEL